VQRLDELYQEAFGWGPAQLACVHLALGCYLAPRWPDQKSPWSLIIGPQSCGKSTILSMFEGIPYTVSVDKLTRNAFTSCFVDENSPDADYSMLHKLSVDTHPAGEKVWVIQELSSVLAMDPVTLADHFANLRAAEVGRHTTQSGMSGTHTRNVGAFGLLIGTTEAFEPMRLRMTTFGERFLAIRMSRRADTFDEMVAESTRAWACNARNQARLERLIREETHKIVNRGITNLKEEPPEILVPSALMERLAAWTTIHRRRRRLPASHIASRSRCGLGATHMRFWMNGSSGTSPKWMWPGACSRILCRGGTGTCYRPLPSRAVRAPRT